MERIKKSKLINYTTQDFVSEKELELKLFRWNNIKDKYLPKLKANGILRIVTTKVWNKEGVSRLGHLFEYEDDKAYQKCQQIFQEIERNEKEDQLIKNFGNRGVVLRNMILGMIKKICLVFIFIILSNISNASEKN